MPDSKTQRSLGEAINTYNDTVDALICLGHVLTWDDNTGAYRPNAVFALGRRVDTSEANRVVPKSVVTPDLITVIAPNYGLLAEAKPSFHGTVAEREDDLRQVMKYDDDLIGWPTPNEKIANTDVVLLVHYSRKGDAQDILEGATQSGAFRMSRNFSAMSFTRSTQVQEFMSLEHFWGKLTEAAIQRRFRPLLVPLERVRPLYPAMMYDDPPPPPLLMQLAWDNVFNRLISIEDYQSAKRVFEIQCSVEQVRDLLAEACGPPRIDSRQPQIPRMDWVKEMFDLLTKMELAKPLGRNTSEYKVFYRKKKLAYFVDKYLKITAVRKSRGRPKSAARMRIKDHPELPF